MPRTKATGRSANGNGSIRKITTTRNGKQYTYWQARYTEGFDPGTGKQIQRSITGKTQKEVAQKLKQATLDIDLGVYQTPDKMTVGEWLDVWTTAYMGDKKYLTVKNYKSMVNIHIKPSLGAIQLRNLTPPMIQKFYNDLLTHGQRVRKRDENGKIVKRNGKVVYEQVPMAAKTVRNIHGILTKALHTAVNMDYLRANPADRVTLPRVEKAKIKPLTDEQVGKFLKNCDEDDYGLLMKVILFTGVRESEAIGLTWDCVDFDHNTIFVNKQLQKTKRVGGQYVLVPTKNSRSRTVTVAPSVMAVLKKQRARQAEMRLLAGPEWDNPWNLVFTNEVGGHLTHRAVYDQFKDVVRSIRMGSERFHDMRHPYVKHTTKKYYLQKQKSQATIFDNLGFLFSS